MLNTLLQWKNETWCVASLHSKKDNCYLSKYRSPWLSVESKGIRPNQYQQIHIDQVDHEREDEYHRKGYLNVAKNSFPQLKMEHSRCMHKLTNIIHTIGDVRPCKSQILKPANNTPIQMGIREGYIGHGKFICSMN